MTYCVLGVACGAMGGDRLVGDGRTIRLEYRVPASSSRQARIDYDLDVLGWLDYDVAAVDEWLHAHDLWMGRRVRGCRAAT